MTWDGLSFRQARAPCYPSRLENGMHRLAAICLLVSPLAAGAASAVEPGPETTDEHILKAVGLQTDGAALLDFFRSRAQLIVSPEAIQRSLDQLAKGPEHLCRRAAGELVASGPPAVPLLRQAAKDADNPPLMEWARRCLEAIGNSELPAAAARLVADQRPRGAAAVLLAYLPFADDDRVADEVQAALDRVAVRDGQPDEAVLAALNDSRALRRAAAGVALCRGGGPSQVPVVRLLLEDPLPSVRLQVALALADLHEEAAIPVLIGLLGQVPAEQGRQIIERLAQLAGKQRPDPVPNPPDDWQRCRHAWAAWWRSIDSASLLGFFQDRTLSDKVRDRVQTLIRQLGDDSFDVRETASAKLLAMGPSVLPLLHRAETSSDQEVVSRARDCLKVLDHAREGELTVTSAARLLALRKPAGSAPILLGYLPFAEDETALDAAQEALAAVAFGKGKMDAAILAALKDPSPLRRAAAVTALCGSGSSDLAPARELLHDRDPAVRLPAAVALAHRHHQAAIPVLIDLLGAPLPALRTGQIEEILQRLAGDHAPASPAGSDETARNRCRQAWSAWWQEYGSQIDLARLDGPPHLLGYTLLVLGNRNIPGQVQERGTDGKIRWEISGLLFPTDVRVLPGNRVLIAEYHGQQVTERDFQNRIVWKRQVAMPINCQRLANGNTVIVSRNMVQEIDRQNKEVFTYRRPQHDLAAGARLRDGRIVCLTTTGFCLCIDAAGREIRSFPIGPCALGSIDVLSGGRVLAPQPVNNRVVEFDLEGKVVWQAPLSAPNSAVRLANGHTLVACNNTQRLVELDRSGKVITEKKLDANPWHVSRR
jgi:HEAT repeat protein